MGLTRREFVCATAAAGIGALAVPGRASAATLSSPLVGAKVREISWSRANYEIGPLRVTRRYYPGALPTEFTRAGIPSGVRIIVSYKVRSANTASYVRSIPSGADVELAGDRRPLHPAERRLLLHGQLPDERDRTGVAVPQRPAFHLRAGREGQEVQTGSASTGGGCPPAGHRSSGRRSRRASRSSPKTVPGCARGREFGSGRTGTRPITPAASGA